MADVRRSTRVPASLSDRVYALDTFVLLFACLACVSLSGNASLSANVRLTLLGFGVLAGALAGVLILRRSVVLSAEHIVSRTAFSPTLVPWSSVAGLSFVWEEGGRHRPRGFRIEIATWDALAAVRRSPVVISRREREVIVDYVRQHHPDIVIDPDPPWRDRHGRWHGPDFEWDPLESIRTVRRAAVGPWRMRVTIDADDRFRAIVEAAHGGAVTQRGPLRLDLPAAITDAERFIRAAQRATSPQSSRGSQPRR